MKRRWCDWVRASDILVLWYSKALPLTFFSPSEEGNNHAAMKDITKITGSVHGGRLPSLPPGVMDRGFRILGRNTALSSSLSRRLAILLPAKVPLLRLLQGPSKLRTDPGGSLMSGQRKEWDVEKIIEAFFDLTDGLSSAAEAQ